MKRLICYARTIKELEDVVNVFFNFGALYVAHDFVEISNKYIKTRKRFEQKLKCQTCGKVSISWRK